jgi:hypothetical protein
MATTPIREWTVLVPFDDKPPTLMVTHHGFYCVQSLELLTGQPIDWHVLETMVWAMNYQLDEALENWANGNNTTG